MTDAAGRPASGTITHRDILRGLTTSQKRHLTMRSNAMGLRQLALHLGLIVVLVAANASSDGMIRLAAMTAQGIAMVFLFTAMHECSHGTAFRSGWINRLVGAQPGFCYCRGRAGSSTSIRTITNSPKTRSVTRSCYPQNHEGLGAIWFI